MADVKDVKVLMPDGHWQSIVGTPGKDAGITKADFDKLDQRLKAVEAALAKLADLPYAKGDGIEIK